MQKYKASLAEVFSILLKNSSNIRLLVPFQIFFVILDGIICSRIPVFLKFIVDAIQASSGSFDQKIVLNGSVFGLSIGLGWYTCAVLQHYLLQKITINLMVNVQQSLYSHLQNLSVDFYQANYVGEITSRLTNDIYNSITELYRSSSVMIWIFSLLIPSFITMSRYNTNLFYIFFIFVIFNFGISHFIIPRMRKKERDVQDSRGKINARITENINCMQLIKSYARENETTYNIRKELKSYLAKVMDAARLRVIYRDTLVTIISFLSPFAILLIGYSMRLSAGIAVAFFTYWRTAGSRLQAIIENITNIITALASFDRICEFYRHTPLVNEQKDAPDIMIEKGNVIFDNVNFSYPLNKESTVLHDISFTVSAGSKIAIVGESGSGKTSITNLLLRFYDPDSGSIQIDKQEISQYSQRSLRDQIALVMQDTILLNGTIKDNMSFIKQEASDNEIMNALERAEAMSFISGMEKGIHTIIGEKGVRLSGGQKQRLSLARAFLKDPKIIVFDEATSSLDAYTEQQIHKTLDTLLKGKTAIIISHRLSIILDCDRIVFLKQGRISRIGSHDELYNTLDDYKDLCLRQNITAN